MKRMKVPGSGRKPGSKNIIQSELKEHLRLHLCNELEAIQERINELPLHERYKVAAMLFKLVISPANDFESNAPNVILVPHNL